VHAVTPITIEEFLSKPDNKNVYYMVTGTISSLKGSNGKDNDYGNLYITDGTNELYVYDCYPGRGATGDARKFFIAENGIQVGDELTMIGYKDTYNGLVELCGGTCFSFKHAE
jgi:RPA family protein